jgi:hypothetical protein
MANGTATLSFSFSQMSLGDQMIYAAYNGDANNGSAISPQLTQTVLNGSAPTYGSSSYYAPSYYHQGGSYNGFYTSQPYTQTVLNAGTPSYTTPYNSSNYNNGAGYYQPINSHWYSIDQGYSRSFYPYVHCRVRGNSYPFTSSPPWWY